MKPLPRRRTDSLRRFRRSPIALSLEVLAASGILAHGGALASPPAPGVRIPLTAVPTGPATQTRVVVRMRPATPSATWSSVAATSIRRRWCMASLIPTR